METLQKPSALISRLQTFETFQHIDESALEWLVEKSEYNCYETGDLLFRPGQAVDHMQVIMEGRYVIEMEQNGRTRELGIWGTGYVTGVLPFSRMKEAKAYGRALERCCVLELHRRHFTEMVNVSYELVQALVSVMSSRIRDFTSMRFQNEKLMALGKLSAGLAHELNNPASAMVRDAEELYAKHHSTPEKFKAIMTMGITPAQTDRVNELLFTRLRNLNQLDLSSLDRMEISDDLLDWLEDHGIEEADDIADTFVDFGMSAEDLDVIEAIVGGSNVGAILWWLESTLSMEKLVQDIRESAGRINTLIHSVKQYSHMDRAVTMERVDLHDGLRSTLVMLKHPLKENKVEVVKEFDKELPKLKAFPGELNQVWTNLISNAIDAMEDQPGTLTIRTYRARGYLCVDIIDTGTGIPEENITRIFEPFFTTKSMDKGTGMGLDIVKRILDRHRAQIDVESRAGYTRFTLCFPSDT